MADPGDAWVDQASPKRSTIIGDARSIECPRRDRTRPEASNDKAPAGPARRPVKIRVGVAKAAFNMMRWTAGERRRPYAPTGNKQEQQSLKYSRPRTHRAFQHLRAMFSHRWAVS